MSETAVLVDSNVLIDLMGEPNPWTAWSIEQCKRLSATHTLAINPVVYAEIAFQFSHESALNRSLTLLQVQPVHMPFSAAFLAAKCHKRYRDAGGMRAATLPDFFIGAHAMVDKLPLLTRDGRRYKTYFPDITLICPPL